MKNEKSCGAIVISDEGKVLVVQQKSGFYGFPKGHCNDGESEMETAIREVKEETNVDIEIANDALRFSLYYIQKETINKEVIYYIAKPKNENVIAQQPEINSVLWVEKEMVKDVLTFDNLKELWENVIQKMN